MSEDLHVNEIECMHLLVSANQEWGLLGRDPLDIYCLAVGLWYTERRDLLTSLYMLLRAAVLDQGFEGLVADLVSEVRSYLEDLIGSGLRQRIIYLIKVYDMRFELNEIEARREQYPSTISFINLLNILMSDEWGVSDRGHRFIGMFRFVYPHVFGPFPQKWQLVVACLEHFQMMLSMYDIGEEDSDACTDQSQNLLVRHLTQFICSFPL